MGNIYAPPQVWDEGISKAAIASTLNTVDDGIGYSTYTDSLIYIIDGHCDTAYGDGADIVLEENLLAADKLEHLEACGWVVDGDNYFAFSRAVMMASLDMAAKLKASPKPKKIKVKKPASEPVAVVKQEPYVSKWNEDNPYGEWINPEGERIVLIDQCSHTKHCSYEYAHSEGWVAIVYGSHFLAIRFNPATTTRKVYNVVLQVIKEHQGDTVLIEDILTNPFGNINSQDSSKKYITRIIQQLKFNKLVLTDRFSDGEPYYGYEELERIKRREEKD